MSEYKTDIGCMIDGLYDLLRDEREEVMSLPDDEIGRPHSHGETDNDRGLRIRALSIAITKLDEVEMWVERSFENEQ